MCIATVTRSQECMAQHKQALSLSLSSASKAFADLSDVQTIISDWLVYNPTVTSPGYLN